MEESYSIETTEEYDEWFDCESPRSQYQIEKRLSKIISEGYFGRQRSVTENEKGWLYNFIWELKFTDGRRIYYAKMKNKIILLLFGGNKNGQDQDVSKAKNICFKYMQGR